MNNLHQDSAPFEEDRVPLQIVVWACPECGYWRQERSTGVHYIPDPRDPRGHQAMHELVEAYYAYAGEAV